MNNGGTERPDEALEPGTVLVVDDEEQMLRSQERMLVREGYAVLTATSANEALDRLRGADHDVDVVLTDLRMEGMDGMQFVETAKRLYPDLEIIMMTGYGTIETAVEAMRKGAYDFLPKPFKRMQLLKIVSRAMERRSLLAENRRLRQQVADGGGRSVVGNSDAMRRVLDMVAQVAPSEATVLILGESGTGKEVVARAIHEASDRARKPFVKVSCAALPDSLLEAELFGYERGAFTGADRRKPGRFELADGGTLFLDEIGDIPLEMQVKLLRVLQEREFERLGGTQTIGVDVRVLAATHRDLRQQVEKGRFREDLYYRLAVIPLEVPPLRVRPDDVPLLAAHFAAKYARDDTRIPALLPETNEALVRYDWPGNVRELENAIERAVVLCKDGVIGPHDLPPHVGTRQGERDGAYLKVPIGTTMREVEDLLIDQALQLSQGDKQKAAALLGISARTITRHLNARED
ncbi:MAG TPA: sigma-54 dependent transcriptional regulator [Candidatus Krumholzibacteria bacterium]|nr:sigma-54 dependent transcriptional regulator [Candidatus Krumholzibacteria bacterium]